MAKKKQEKKEDEVEDVEDIEEVEETSEEKAVATVDKKEIDRYGKFTRNNPELNKGLLDGANQFTKEMIAQAQELVDSGLLPDSVDTPQKAIVIMKTGRELGFTEMASLQYITVINGRPALMGTAMIAKLREAGVEYKTLEDYLKLYKVGDDEYNEQELKEKGLYPTSQGVKLFNVRTTIEFRRRSSIDGSIITEKGTWTYKEAEAAGLLNKDNWKKYPRPMYWWRAFSVGARRIASDALAGMHTPEELDTSGTIYLNEQGEMVKLKK